MLIVQRITTQWTKASRGGTGASDRNATPSSLHLPPEPSAGVNCFLHDAEFLESQNFECGETSKEIPAGPHLQIPPLFVHVTPHRVAARFVWSWRHCGAPERDSHELFELSPGQWGRFTCNGRFGAETHAGREWSYHKTVFNVAFVPEFDEKLFVGTVPNAEDARLAKLK